MNTSLATLRPHRAWLAGAMVTGLVTAALLGGPASLASAQSEGADTVRSITVTGTGRVKAEPDVADVQLGVTKDGEDAQAAAQDAAETMSAVIASLIDNGIAETDIQTTSISLNPNYDYSKDTPRIIGWQASNMVNVTVRDLDTVGDGVDAAIAAGANSVNGITFRVDDPSGAEAAARSAAVADARAKADQLASDAGVTITGVISISESGAQPPQPLFYASMERAVGGADTMAATPVLPGQVDVQVDVYIQYEIS